MRLRLAWLGLLILTASTMQASASPSCTLPYNLLNGQTADATQVMADYNAIIGSVSPKEEQALSIWLMFSLVAN
jgi:hypothetical protein